MDEFPAKEFWEINRHLFVAIDECRTDEAIEAQQAATREVASASRAVKKLCDILKKEPEK